jgi:hypothetical protein
MQSLPVYLYPNSLEVILDLDPDVRGVNQVMYQRDLKIQKGIKNNVRIQFKNSDQKRIPISNTSTFVFNMFDPTNQQLILQKELNILDDATTSTRGLALLTINEGDTIDLASVSYQYSIIYQDPRDGTYLPAYSNTYYGMVGTLHLTEEVFPKLKPSQEIVSFLKSYNSAPAVMAYEHKSGNIYAYPEFNANSALHTMALYMTRYKGTVQIQGTLYNSPQELGRYVTIATRTYDGFTGVDYLNFNGVFSYVRVVYVPAKDLTNNNDNPAFYGSFDKVLYRS